MKHPESNSELLGKVEPGPEILKELEVRPVADHEMERVRQFLNDGH